MCCAAICACHSSLIRGGEAAPADRAAYRANREVRHTIIRLIGAHLRAAALVSWQGLNLDFTGVF